jgi:peptide/nickel transport system substrate-binding protein
MKRIVNLVLLAAMVLAMLTACAGNTTATEAPAATEAALTEVATEATTDIAATEAVKDDTLIVAVSTEPQTLNVADVALLYTDAVLRLLYSNLVRLDSDMTYVPDLAESYEAISDTEWKFVLREGVTFSDGTPVTSEDCAASIQLVHDSAAIGAYAAWLKEVKIIDDRTFVIVTEEPSERILLDLAHYNYIVPKKLIDEGYNFSENPVGTGPYTLVEWKLGDRLVFKAREDYFNPEEAAQIENLIWRIMPEGVSRTIALENGEVDFLYDVQATDLAQLSENPEITVYSTDYASPFYLAFNTTKPGMDDINVRKAIASAINRDNATLLATNGYSSTITSAFAPNLLGSSDVNAVGYDVAKAKEYMAASAYNGQTLTYTVITKEEPFKIALESVQADLLEIGINLQIELLDASTYTARGKAGEFDMIVGKYGTSDLLIYAAGAFKTGGAFNFNFVSDEYIDNLIDTGLKTIDQEERAAIITELVEYVNDQCYRTGIYLLTTTRAFNANLDGFETNLESYDQINKLYWK